MLRRSLDLSRCSLPTGVLTPLETNPLYWSITQYEPRGYASKFLCMIKAFKHVESTFGSLIINLNTV